MNEKSERTDFGWNICEDAYLGCDGAKRKEFFLEYCCGDGCFFKECGGSGVVTTVLEDN